MKIRKWWFAAGILAIAAMSREAIIIYNANLVNTPALAFNSAYTLDLQSLGISSLSVQANFSSATIANVPFQDGSESTGSFTVSNFAALSTAPASDSLTVLSTSNLLGATIVLPGFTLTNGIDWATLSTTSGTADSIASALRTVPFLSVSRSGSVVYATAPAGSYYNSFQLQSTNSNVTVATPFFTGGQDNATLRINGVSLQANRQWTAATSNSATASSLASAINASSLHTLLTAQAIGNVVTATSTLNGSSRNFLLQSSTPALALSGSHMVNGSNPAFTLGSSLFTASGGSNLTTALPVLYSQGTKAIGGLTNQTTYYAVPTLLNNTFMLSKYSTSAVAGVDLVVVTSTNSQTTSTESLYTLAPLPISGTPGLSWTVSNDGITFSPLLVDSVTINSYTPGGASFFWPFGYIGTRFLRLNAVAPTTGGLQLKVIVVGTN